MHQRWMQKEEDINKSIIVEQKKKKIIIIIREKVNAKNKNITDCSYIYKERHEPKIAGVHDLAHYYKTCILKYTCVLYWIKCNAIQNDSSKKLRL